MSLSLEITTGQQLVRLTWRISAQQLASLPNGQPSNCRRSNAAFFLIYRSAWISMIAPWYMAALMDHYGSISLLKYWQNAASSTSAADSALLGIPTCPSSSSSPSLLLLTTKLWPMLLLSPWGVRNKVTPTALKIILMKITMRRWNWQQFAR